jgi:hypothetical protein
MHQSRIKTILRGSFSILVYELIAINVFLIIPSSGILKKTTLRKLDQFPSSGQRVGDGSSIASVRKSRPQQPKPSD